MATKANNGNKKFGAQRGNVRSKIVRMRTKDQMSWVDIAGELNIAPRTARRLFDEKMGDGAHFGLLDGKGGRRKADTPDAEEA